MLQRLHEHLQERLGRTITPTSLSPNRIRAGAAEFALVDFEGRDGTQSAGQQFRRVYLGYVALHFPEDTPVWDLIPDDLAIQRAFETFWPLPEIAEARIVTSFTYGDATAFLNALPNVEEGPTVLTLTADWTLILDIPTEAP